MITYRNPIQTSQRVQGVHQTSDEAHNIVLPASLVDPSSEYELGVVMVRSRGSHRDHRNKPCQLQVDHFIRSATDTRFRNAPFIATHGKIC